MLLCGDLFFSTNKLRIKVLIVATPSHLPPTKYLYWWICCRESWFYSDKTAVLHGFKSSNAYCRDLALEFLVLRFLQSMHSNAICIIRYEDFKVPFFWTIIHCSWCDFFGY